MSILEDYDHDANEIRSLELDIGRLCETLSVVEQYGSTRCDLRLMCVTGLLSTSSHMALEALLEHDMALEGDVGKQSIIASIQDKAAQWSAKILSFFKDKSSALIKKVSDLWATFKEKLPLAKEKIAQSVQSGKEYVKAHPYRVVAGALAAAISVMGIVSFAGRMLPTVTNSKAMVTFSNALVTKINAVKWPFGPVGANVVSGGKKVAVSVAAVGAVAGTAKLAHLGWTKINAEQLDRGLETLCGGIEHAWDFLAPKVTTLAKGAVSLVTNTFKTGVAGFAAGHDAFVDQREIPKTLSETSILQEGRNIAVGGLMAAGTVLLFWGSSILYVLYTLLSKVIGAAVRLCVDTIQRLSHPTSKEYV